LTPGDIFASTSSFSSASPNVFHFDSAGGFEGFFFRPFDVGDFAVSKEGELLVGSSRSGTIARLDANGGLLGLISTPATAIHGLAVSSSNDIYVAEGSSNKLFRLDSSGNFLDLAFVNTNITHLSMNLNDDIVFTRPSGGFNSPRELVIFDFASGIQSTIPTPFLSIGGIAVAPGGEFLVAGRSGCCGSLNTISTLDANGSVLSSFIGPTNINALGVVVMPEPGAAGLLGLSLAGLALLRRRLASTSTPARRASRRPTGRRRPRSSSRASSST
jgi:WD40 repeat protein